MTWRICLSTYVCQPVVVCLERPRQPHLEQLVVQVVELVVGQDEARDLLKHANTMHSVDESDSLF